MKGGRHLASRVKYKRVHESSKSHGFPGEGARCLSKSGVENPSPIRHSNPLPPPFISRAFFNEVVPFPMTLPLSKGLLLFFSLDFSFCQGSFPPFKNEVFKRFKCFKLFPNDFFRLDGISNYFKEFQKDSKDFKGF